MDLLQSQQALIRVELKSSFELLALSMVHFAEIIAVIIKRHY